MKYAFDPKAPVVLVRAALSGPAGIHDLSLALDTGATTTLINTAHLILAGYIPSSAPTVPITLASGIQYVPKIAVQRLESLGAHRVNLSVLSVSLPPTSGIDGLLGLDFLRDKRLAIDFQKGKIDLR